MFFTSIELWVALDDCALRKYPILQNYDPGFPPTLFEPFLLPKRSQMERLLMVEKYLFNRRDLATYKSELVFLRHSSQNSLSLRYFADSQCLQDLRRQIENEAQVAITLKISEFRTKKEQHGCLMQEYVTLSCHYEYVRQGTTYQRELASSPLRFMSGRFLKMTKWRDTTYGLLVDIFSPPTESSISEASQLYFLNKYAGLKGYVKSPPSRTQLTSVTKPFVVSHYRETFISGAREELVSVNNGLNSLMFDTKKTNGQETSSATAMCTLQYAVDNSVHTSNEVIAGQSKCPDSLTMHEYYAFATLRSGYRLQRRNIARELIAGVLNFCTQETHILVIQAAWQVGPLGDGAVSLETHADLEEEAFGKSLLLALNHQTGLIENNWQGADAVQTFVALTTRLLSFATTETVRQNCFYYRQRACKITLGWSHGLQTKLQNAQTDKELETFSVLTLEMALLCYGTFDVDPDDLPRLLMTKEDCAGLIECSIVVHDRCPASLGSLFPLTRSLLRRHWKLSHLIEPLICELVTGDPSSIDILVSRLWAGYKPGAGWRSIEAPQQRWITTTTSPCNGAPPSIVHYNLLNRDLWVNGLPLNRLPRSYELHQTFSWLFGKKIFDVVPSTAPGMEFESRDRLHGYQIFFAMHNANLIVQLRKETLVYEVLPTHALDGDFPFSLDENYVQLLHVNTGIVEWRLLEGTWITSQANWRMQRDDSDRYRLNGESSSLIDIYSSTAEAIHLVLGPLEIAPHILVALNNIKKSLMIHLPRFKLDFVLRKDALRLESKQYRGMFVDSAQSFDALTGLRNKHVLKSKTSRSVIVPYGKVEFTPRGCHV
ncbi:MAG: hypothetical protein M1829_001369 [Trizodia sp. TS-e1964]|nr:MAG: hypothetical protein M1829_001369 [Trizodia sp. TS-e1964]